MYCSKCQKNIQTLEVDGYAVGDRLLEDVHFLFELKNGKVVNLRTRYDCKDYMADLNEKRWLKAVREYAQSIVDDEDWESLKCDTCYGNGTVVMLHAGYASDYTGE